MHNLLEQRLKGAPVEFQQNGHEEIPAPEESLAASEGGQQTNPPQLTGSAALSLPAPSTAPPPPPPPSAAFLERQREERILSNLMGRLDQLGISVDNTGCVSDR